MYISTSGKYFYLLRWKHSHLLSKYTESISDATTIKVTLQQTFCNNYRICLFWVTFVVSSPYKSKGTSIQTTGIGQLPEISYSH